MIEKIMHEAFGESKKKKHVKNINRFDIDKYMNNMAMMESSDYIDRIFRLHARSSLLQNKDIDKYVVKYNAYSESVNWYVKESIRQFSSYFSISKTGLIKSTQRMIKRRIADIQNQDNTHYYVASELLDYATKDAKTFIKSKKRFKNDNSADLLTSYLACVELMNESVTKGSLSGQQFSFIEDIKDKIIDKDQGNMLTGLFTTSLTGPLSILLFLAGKPILGVLSLSHAYTKYKNSDVERLLRHRKGLRIRVKKEVVISILNSLNIGLEHLKDLHLNIEKRIKNDDSKISKEEFNKLKPVLSAWRKSIFAMKKVTFDALSYWLIGVPNKDNEHFKDIVSSDDSPRKGVSFN